MGYLHAEVCVLPSVSVIIPAFNAERYVAGAVLSALQQTTRDIEVLVVDDASSDGTASVAREAAAGDPRILLLLSKVNGGPSVARNRGLQQARGRWVALLDADDRFAPNRLQRLVQQAEREEVDLIADNLAVLGPDGQSATPAVAQRFMNGTGDISAAEFVRWDRPARGLKSVGFLKPLMRTEFLREHQLFYDARFRNAEDFHFYVRCLLAGGKLRVTTEAWYQYQYRANSQSRGAEAAFPQQLIESNRDLENFAEQCGDRAALAQLRKRRQDIKRWIPYVDFVKQLRSKRFAAALRSFAALPSQSYAVRRLLEAGMRRTTGNAVG